MNRKISFLNMDHSKPLEVHVNQKIDKIQEYLDEEELPQRITVRLTTAPLHVHHKVEIQLKTKNFDLNVSKEGTNMYIVTDEAIDKLVALLKKEKGILSDKHRKHNTEKKEFIKKSKFN